MKPGIVFLFLAAAIWVPRTSGAQNPGGQQPAPSAPAQPAAQAPAKQPAQPPAAEPEEGAPLNKLGLSDDQKRQIHGFRKKAQQQVQAVKSDTSLTAQEQAQQIRQIRRKTNQQVEGVLTPDQREKYDAWRRAHQRRHSPPPKPAGA